MGYGIVKADDGQKLSYNGTKRWNDGIKRHTLYTCIGTTTDTWGMDERGVRSENLGVTGSFDALVGAAANPTFFNWVPIAYPASAPMMRSGPNTRWSPPDVSMGQSLNMGIAELKSQIQATPGTFAMIGASQGAAVISGVLQELMAGGLTSRYNDCIAGIAFGNPCRQAGKTFPGGTDPGGAGIFPSGNGPLGWVRNNNTPSWWWELAAPNDPIATTPANAGGDFIRYGTWALLNYEGGLSNLSMLENILEAFLIRGTAWKWLIEIISTGGDNLKQAIDFIKLQLTINPTPHVMYGRLSPPTLPTGLGLSAGATFVDVALAYINSRGAAVTPR